MSYSNKLEFCGFEIPVTGYDRHSQYFSFDEEIERYKPTISIRIRKSFHFSIPKEQKYHVLIYVYTGNVFIDSIFDKNGSSLEDLEKEAKEKISVLISNISNAKIQLERFMM